MDQDLSDICNFDSRTLYLVEDVTEVWCKKTLRALDVLERQNPRKKIKIIINSSGGSLPDVMAVIGRLQLMDCPIVTIGLGYVMSSAVLLFAAGHTRKLSNYAQVLLHEASTSLKGSISSIEAELEQLKIEEAITNQFLERQTGTKKWDILSAGEIYMSAAEALESNLATKLF